MRSRSFAMVVTSFSSGRFETRSSSAVSSAAAMIGSAAFFAPATRISPDSGTPPWMESLCMEEVRPSSARCPFLGGKGLHRQRVDLLAHALAERRVHQLVALHATEPREFGAHDDRLEMRAVAAHLEVRAREAGADRGLDGARFDHGRGGEGQCRSL